MSERIEPAPFPEWTEREPWKGTMVAALARLGWAMANLSEAVAETAAFRLAAPALNTWAADVKKRWAVRPDAVRE